MSWTGSEQQRNKHRDDCVYPSAKPTPRPVVYHVPKKTHGLTKRVGDKVWNQHETTKPLTFDSVYRQTERCYIFFCIGHLLCVDQNFVDVQTFRAGDAIVKPTEDIDAEYQSIVGGASTSGG